MSDPINEGASHGAAASVGAGVVSREQDGQTVAAVVRALLGGVPWSRARKLCTDGRVLRDGEPVLDPAQRVRRGETLEVRPQSGRPRDPDIELRHVDPDIVVVDKPAGLVTVPFAPEERDTLVHRAHAALRRREGGRHLPPLRVVQRLDKDTSGVLVFARTRRAERGLGEQFRRHEVQRLYLALAYGAVREATHDTWIVPDRGDGRRGTWHRGPANRPATARRAITHVKVRERFTGEGLRWSDTKVPGITLVECKLETGRQHQIRIHLGEQGTPLVGEKVYDRDYRGPRLRIADAEDVRRSGKATSLPEDDGRPMLHAAELGFVHPTRDTPLRFVCDLPSDFADLLRRLRGGPGP
jgi:23S rRNA pseudouridine1911/1915/1917 synthase